MAKRNTQQKPAPSQVSDAITATYGMPAVLRLDVDVPSLAREEGDRYPDAPAFDVRPGYIIGAEWADHERVGIDLLIRTKGALEGADFAHYAEFRDACKAGYMARKACTTEACDIFWSRTVLSQLKGIGFTPPKSPKSSATRVLSAEAQKTADDREVERERLSGMTIAEVKREAKSASAADKARLYKVIAGKENALAKDNAKLETSERKVIVKAIDDAVSAMTLKQVKRVLVEVNKILASGK